MAARVVLDIFRKQYHTRALCRRPAGRPLSFCRLARIIRARAAAAPCAVLFAAGQYQARQFRQAHAARGFRADSRPARRSASRCSAKAPCTASTPYCERAAHFRAPPSAELFRPRSSRPSLRRGLRRLPRGFRDSGNSSRPLTIAAAPLRGVARFEDAAADEYALGSRGVIISAASAGVATPPAAKFTTGSPPSSRSSKRRAAGTCISFASSRTSSSPPA